MKYMTKYLALGLALVLCLGTLWGCGKQVDDEPSETPDPSADNTSTDEELLPLTGSDTIECSNGSVTLRFSRNENEHWKWKDDTSFPLDETYVTELLATAQEIFALTPANLTGELSEYGLDSTGKYLSLTSKDGKSVTYYLGNLTNDGCYYLRRADDAENKIYVAPVALTAQINRSIYDMAALPRLSAIAADNVKSISVSTSGEAPVSVHLTPSGDGKWVADTTDKTEAAQALIGALVKLELLACVDYMPSAGAAAICGLDPAQLTLSVAYINSVGVESALTLRVGTSRTTGYHAMVNEDPSIYAVGPDIVLAMSALVK